MVALLALASPSPANDLQGSADSLLVGEPYTSPDLSSFGIEADEDLTVNGAQSCTANGGTRMDWTDWTSVTGNGRQLTATATASWPLLSALYSTSLSSIDQCYASPDNAPNVLQWSSTAGQVYPIQVGGCLDDNQSGPVWCYPHPGGFPSSYALLVTSAPLPNDLRANAITFGPDDGQQRYDTHGAGIDGEGTPTCTLPGGAPPSLFRSTVWFKYTADKGGTGTFTATPVLSDPMDTVIAVYRGAETTPLACDDNPKDDQGEAAVAVDVSKGVTYYVQVGAYYADGYASDMPPRHQGQFTYRVRFGGNNDGDPEGNATDCAPDDPTRYHGAPDVFNDGIDQDCNGRDNKDFDNDGYDFRPAGKDCNDKNASIHPTANEVPGNKVDENCDGRIPAADLSPSPSIGLYSTLVAGRGRIYGAARIAPVARGYRIVLRCRGAGCGSKSKKVIVARKRKSVRTNWTNGRVLPRGAGFEVSVTRPGANRIGVYQRNGVGRGLRAKTRTCDLAPKTFEGKAFKRVRCGKS
jgi:hypothetical protein